LTGKQCRRQVKGVDGRILKGGGKLVALDTPKVIAEARAALAGVRERTKWR
jgi:hypothetical protein